MAWRAPGIQAGTTLFVNYPGINYGDNNDAVDGPANFIYFPEQTNQIPVTYQFYALPQISSTTNDVLAGKNRSEGYRTHVALVNFDQFLIMSQPSGTACVHVIDARWPLFSSSDPDQVLLIGGHSNIESILPGQRSPKLAQFIFGPEPAHRWCYYFEKAELAVQTGDWQKVAELGNEAAKQGLHPEDPVEWIPFLQAYADLGDAAIIQRYGTQDQRRSLCKERGLSDPDGHAEFGIYFCSGHPNSNEQPALQLRPGSRRRRAFAHGFHPRDAARRNPRGKHGIL